MAETKLHLGCPLAPESDRLWELFHENSKTHPLQQWLTDTQVAAQMDRMHVSFDYQHCPQVPLEPLTKSIEVPLGSALSQRESARTFDRVRTIDRQAIATALVNSFGSKQPARSRGGERPARSVPSAGALYPLEYYLITGERCGFPNLLAHFHPVDNVLSALQRDLSWEATTDLFFQRGLIRDAAAIVVITAVFERSTFKYRERGYRFILLEAGHAAQNLCLVGASIGMNVLPLGGYDDRALERLIGIDGVSHSVVYAMAIG